MTLPVQPPIEPMLAKPIGNAVPATGPKGESLLYEPKWDGFRCLIFKDGNSVFIQSRQGEDLAYCFPEVAEAARRLLPDRIVLDGELVIASDGRLWFEQLGQRIRPRSEEGGWKIAELSEQHPASYVAFDLLAVGDRNLMETAFQARRSELESIEFAAPFHRTPATNDVAVGQHWFERFEGAGLDGVIAKPTEGSYEPGKRSMYKIKPARTADVVIGGWRPYKQPGPNGAPVVGSLLLGLYDEAGNLHHIGVAASFTAKRRTELTEQLRPLAVTPDDPHPWYWGQVPEAQRRPGMKSRWSTGKDLTFQPIRPELVAEVGYDHMEGSRLRHVAKLIRFRPDRSPDSCTYDQLDQANPIPLEHVVPGLG